jgi:putative ABC transport system permease protein
MSFFRLLLRNLFYHWRGNLAVFLGIALGSAVLTGALLVGDSLRGSLKALTLDQLGWVEEAMVPGRFFSPELAPKIAAERIAPAVLLQGSASLKIDGDRVGKVTVFGIDASFWPKEQIPEGTAFWASEEREVVLNRTTAQALDAKVGDIIILHLQKADSAPRETILANRKADEIIQPIRVKVRSILADEGMARFSLKPTPEPVRNVFMPIRALHSFADLDLDGRINAVLVAKPMPTMQADLQKQLTLEDWGLRYRSPKDRAEAFVRLLAGKSAAASLTEKKWQDHTQQPPINRVPDELAEIAKKNGGILPKEEVIAFYERTRDYSVLESRRMFLEPSIVSAVDKLSPNQAPRWNVTPILIYLADTISDGKYEIPYSIVASEDLAVLKDDEILLMKWPGFPLKTKKGSNVKLTYFATDENNHLVKREQPFKVFDILDIKGVLDDPDLTPVFPGITDQLDIKSWKNPPFPYDPKRNTKADENYWTRYRTTPKAYVNLKMAQKLWKSRFGDLTSIQVRDGLEPANSLPKKLLEELKPEQEGFVFQQVREQALRASSGANDFGVLFLSFSFFLIVSALLLVGLLVRLNIDRRASEMGLLLATGWDHGRVRWLLLGEGALLSIVGGLVGLAGAVVYASFMLKLLAANWPGGDSLNFLTLHTGPMSFAIGYLASVIVSMVTLYWATRVLSKLSPRSLLHGETTQTTGLADTKPGWSRWLVPAGALGALGLIIIARFLPSENAQTLCFFGSGALLLSACLAAVWNGLNWSNRASSPQPSLARLGIRNAGRQTVRSVLTVGLLAASSFLVVAVESFHKETDAHFLDKTGGSGGFAFYAEGNAPIFEDMNDVKVWREHGLDTPEMRRAIFFPCRVQAGDDASCLNLYKTLKPRVMSYSDTLIKRGGFRFGATLATTAEEKANPWLLLQRKEDDGTIPAILDANTADWVLKVGLGETMEVNDDTGNKVKLRVVALLQESIFQSEVLVAEKNFLTLYPRQSGFSFLLVDPGDDADAHKLKAMEKQLSKSMIDFNMDVQTTASRLQGYLAVRNTYLATFQALGGLSLILGAAGLAIVLLRGVWERRAELALLQALGFRSGQLAWLVLVENAFLLFLGLAAGTVSALLAVAPHLIGMGAQVLWLRIVVLLALVLAVGLLSAVLAVWSTLRTPVLTALRRE